MVGTIVPMVHRERSDGGRAISGWLHMLGCAIGSIVMGGLLGVGGELIPWPGLGTRQIVVPIATGVIGFAYSTRELGLLRLRYLQLRRQVPARWRHTLPPRVAACLYGIALGFGFGTRIPVSTLYVAATWVMLNGNPLLGAILMAPFGIGRAVPLLFIAGSDVACHETFQVNQSLRVWSSVVKLANGVLLGFLGAYLLASGIKHWPVT